MNMKMVAAALAVSAVGFASGASAMGKPIVGPKSWTSSDSCSVNDVSVAATECFGTLLEEPINDSGVDFNVDSFGGLTGIFGYTDWTFLAKKNAGGDLEGTDIGLVLDPDDGTVPVDWSVSAGAFDAFARIFVIVKQGNTFAAYLYDPSITSGSFTSDAFSQDDGVSHFSIYGGGVSVVPLPAGVWLLLTVAGGLGLMKHRNRAKA